MAIEKKSFSDRAARYPLKSFHNKVITYFCNKLGSQKSTDFLDISATGLAFVTLKELTPDHGTVLRLTFTVPGKQPISIKAQVVRVMSYKRPEWYKRYDSSSDKVIEECFIGVNFLNLSEQKKDELDIYLQHLIDQEKKERQVQKMTYLKKEFSKSYKWVIVSGISLLILGISLKVYFD